MKAIWLNASRENIKMITTESYAINYLDTSTLIRRILYPDIKEAGSDQLEKYRKIGIIYETSDLCLGESFGVMKRMRFFKKDGRISKKGYPLAVYRLTYLLKNKRLKINPIDIKQYYYEAAKLVKKHDIDFIDAAQVVFLKKKRSTLFITADKNLAKVAVDQGLLVWNCTKKDWPPGLHEPA